MSTIQEKKTFRYTAAEILQLKDCFYAQQAPINLPDWFQEENDGTRIRQNRSSPFPMCRQGTTYYQPTQLMTPARSYPTQWVPKPRPLFRRSDYDLPLMNVPNGNAGFRPLRPVSPSMYRSGYSFHQRRIQQWSNPPIAPAAPGFSPRMTFVVNFGGPRSPVVNNQPFYF